MNRNNRTLKEFFSIPYPDISLTNDVTNILIIEELSYNREALAREHAN